MSEESDNFEKLISRIHKLLEGEDVYVEWNEKIPDPDNPCQMRQIDVLVKKGEETCIIECRLHKEKQNVKWIEELIGRRISFQANTIIAVSSSGFTTGAIKKANRYGVILKEMKSLSDKEIQSWSRTIDISAQYYRYEDFKLALVFDIEDCKKIDSKDLQSDLEKYAGFNALFKAQLEAIDKKHLELKSNSNARVNFKLRFGIPDFTLCGCSVKEIESSGIAYLEEIELKLPEVLAYGTPNNDLEKRNVFVQNYNLGQTKLIHHDGRISLSIDLSKFSVPPYWQFRYLNVKGKHENHLDHFEIINPEGINMVVDKIDLSIYGECV